MQYAHLCIYITLTDLQADLLNDKYQFVVLIRCNQDDEMDGKMGRCEKGTRFNLSFKTQAYMGVYFPHESEGNLYSLAQTSWKVTICYIQWVQFVMLCFV